LIDVIEGRAGIEVVLPAPIVPPARGAVAVDRGHQGGGAVDHGGIDDLTLAGAFGLPQGADQAEGEIERPATEIPDEIERRGGRLPAPADGMERASQGDVVQ